MRINVNTVPSEYVAVFGTLPNKTKYIKRWKDVWDVV